MDGDVHVVRRNESRLAWVVAAARVSRVASESVR